MINKNPYLIGQRTLELLVKIEMDGMHAEHVLENTDDLHNVEFGRYNYMVDLARDLYEAIDADTIAANIDPQLG